MTLAAREVRWSAGGRMIVDGVTLTAAPGRVLGLVGPNGSGKSSLLRLLCRLRRLESGVVTLDDRPIDALSRRALAQRLAFVEQQAGTEIRLTVEQAVALGRTPHRGALDGWSERDAEAVRSAIERVDMTERAGQLWHTLSGGERQRVHIARALAQAPGELILDEPTNHLDIQHQLSILALLRRIRITCIVALHDLNLAARFCDEIAVMDQSRLVASGAPETVLTEALIGAVFKVPVAIRPSIAGGHSVIEYLVEDGVLRSS